MGEIADAVVNGLLCEGCGVLMPDHQEPGYPRRCPECERVEAEPPPPEPTEADLVRALRWIVEHGDLCGFDCPDELVGPIYATLRARKLLRPRAGDITPAGRAFLADNPP